jgi:hypothetical protein
VHGIGKSILMTIVPRAKQNENFLPFEEFGLFARSLQLMKFAELSQEVVSPRFGIARYSHSLQKKKNDNVHTFVYLP